MDKFKSKYAFVLKSIKKDQTLSLKKNNLYKKTFIISGSSRGIGLNIAEKLASQGANITLVGKTTEKHNKLDGTIYTARDKVLEKSKMNNCIAVPCDIREPEQIDNVISQTLERFNSIDGVVLNASALCLRNTLNQTEKEVNLMNSVNINGTYLFGQKCLKVMNKNDEGRMLIISPPMDVLNNNDWWKDHFYYTMSKFNMTLMSKFWNEEFPHIGINTLWPRTTIDTAPVQNILGGDDMVKISRTKDIMGDAAHIILNSDPQKCQGKNFIDDEVLASLDIDVEKYKLFKNVKEKDLMPDFFC
tara:strand:- start:14316 stop:15221 length:906 start_codon:yes stop_codon:yes gene_type:complete